MDSSTNGSEEPLDKQQPIPSTDANTPVNPDQQSATPHTVIELCSGPGGLALGLENAGLHCELLVENNKDAAATLRRNRPEKNIIERDIRTVDFRDYEGKIDVVAGGYPCQSNSTAGNGKGLADPRGALVFELLRCVSEVRPKVVLIENVPRLKTIDEGRSLGAILDAIRDLGYRTTYRILHAEYHDVPQKRARLFIMAVRDELDIPILFPRQKSYVTPLGDVLVDVPQSEGKEYSAENRKWLELIPPGGNWKDLSPGNLREWDGLSNLKEGGQGGLLRRMHRGKPCLTLTCSPSQNMTCRCHPDETRPFTVREYARIQTFPDSWEFVGSVTSIYRQIGNAVPVKLAYRLGMAIRRMLDGGGENSEFESV